MLEQEADRAADSAVRAAIMRGGAVLGEAGSAHAPGRRLDPAVRSRLERHFGGDFSRVRVHTDDRAARSAEALGARAFTRGGDIAFAAGQYAPHTATGERLLAHELAHVVQQAAGWAPAVQFQRTGAPAAAGPPAAPLPKIAVDRVIDRYVIKVDGIPVAEVKTENEKTSLELKVDVVGDTVRVVMRHKGGASLAAAPPPSMSSKYHVDLREIDERTSAGPTSGPARGPAEPQAGQPEPTGSMPVQVVSPDTVPWRSGKEEMRGSDNVHILTRSADSEFEQRLKREPGLVNGVVLDPENGEVLGYRRASGGVTEYFDREGTSMGMSEIGLETPLIDPIDFIPTPGELVKGVGVAGKLGLKALTKKTVAAEGPRLSMAIIGRMRGVSRALLRRAAREAAEESAVLVRRITVEGLNHSFDRHAAQWFGRQVARETHFAAWRALVERAAASKTVLAWSTGAADTIAHLAYIDGKPFVVQFFKETGELATAFVPNQDQLGAMLRMLGRAR
jgi:Domain of unknown function (DUF4157)